MNDYIVHQPDPADAAKKPLQAAQSKTGGGNLLEADDDEEIDEDEYGNEYYDEEDNDHVDEIEDSK